MQKYTRSTRTTRHCCVKGCTNPPAKGRKTCGKHGKTRAARPTKTTTIHIDRVLHEWRDYDSDAQVSIITTPVTSFPSEQPYLADVAYRSDGSILGLPTTSAGLKALLSAWLLRPGRSLFEIEVLTPDRLPARDRDRAIVNLAERLVRYDLGLGVIA